MTGFGKEKHNGDEDCRTRYCQGKLHDTPAVRVGHESWELSHPEFKLEAEAYLQQQERWRDREGSPEGDKVIAL